MTERKPRPAHIEFFIPTGETPKVEVEKILPPDPATELPAPQEERSAASQLIVPKRSAKEELDALLGGPMDDDPETLLEGLIGSIPRLSDEKDLPTPADLAREARAARHNTHVTAKRMIDLENRRQKREKRGKK